MQQPNHCKCRYSVRVILLGVLAAGPLAALTCGQATGQSGQRLPGGPGLAAAYRGDADIENDPAVIFMEDFEQRSLGQLKKHWDNVKNPEILSLSADRPAGSPGRQSLLMTHVGGQSTGAHLYRRLLPGYEQLFVRFYVKFDPGCHPIHHFFHVGGYNPPTP